jgi:hypothetical protein
LIPMGH